MRMVAHTTNAFFNACLSKLFAYQEIFVSATGDGIPRSSMKCKKRKMFGEWRRIFHIITIVSKLAGEWRRNLHKGDMTRFPFLYGFYDGCFSRFLKKEEKYVNRVFCRLLFVIRFSNMM